MSKGLVFPQFLDEFNNNLSEEWDYFYGDGILVMDFSAEDGIGHITIDASSDQYNVWWSVIKRNVTSSINVSQLQKDGYELRIETKIKISDSPRRINLSVNTQRTTDFHSNLMEYDIPDTANWYTISYTTDNFDAVVGDSVYVQLALMDWGLGRYSAKLDYFKVDIIEKIKNKEDLGNLVPYHPPMPDIDKFSEHLICQDAAILSSKYRNENYYNWGNFNDGKIERLLTISGDQFVILKWNFTKNKIDSEIGDGVLEVELDSFKKGKFKLEELSQIRLVELISGLEDWDSKTITYNNFSGKSKKMFINAQPIYDLDLRKIENNKQKLPVSKYVMNRLITGKSIGLALMSLGPIIVNLKCENNMPTLHFNKLEE